MKAWRQRTVQRSTCRAAGFDGIFTTGVRLGKTTKQLRAVTFKAVPSLLFQQLCIRIGVMQEG
jgi:hypothetical protein